MTNNINWQDVLDMAEFRLYVDKTLPQKCVTYIGLSESLKRMLCKYKKLSICNFYDAWDISCNIHRMGKEGEI